eukprot:322229_1
MTLLDNQCINILNTDKIADSTRKKGAWPIIICAIYLVFYMITVFAIHFLYSMNIELMIEKFELIFVVFEFSVTSKLLKFMMKRTARLIDEIRSTKSINDHYVCLEYLTEWIFDVIHWNFVRFYIVFKAPSPVQFVFVLVVHFSIEMVETNIRYTYTFVKISKYLATKHCCFSLLLPSQNMDINVWRIRLSMDSTVKLWASLLCTIMTFIQFIALGKDWFVSQFGSERIYTVLVYTLISEVIELGHYIISILILRKLYQFNAVKPVVNCVNGIENKHRILLLILYGIMFIVFLEWTRIGES